MERTAIGTMRIDLANGEEDLELKEKNINLGIGLKKPGLAIFKEYENTMFVWNQHLTSKQLEYHN